MVMWDSLGLFIDLKLAEMFEFHLIFKIMEQNSLFKSNISTHSKFQIFARCLSAGKSFTSHCVIVGIILNHGSKTQVVGSILRQGQILKTELYA